MFCVLSWWTLACMELLGQLQQDLRWRHPAEAESVWRAFLWWRTMSRWQGRAEALQWEEMPWLVTLKCLKVATQQFNWIRREGTYNSTPTSQSPMRSALRRTLEMLCGREPPLETWLPSPAPPMPQVQRQRGQRHASFSFYIKPYHANERSPPSLINRSDSAPVHPGRRRPRILGEPHSHQVCLRELWEHSEAGEPWTLN